MFLAFIFVWSIIGAITITAWRERSKEVSMDLPVTSPNATVSLPNALRARAGNRRTVVVNGSTIREIIAALDHDFPGLRFNLCYAPGELRSYVNIFLYAENIPTLYSLHHPLPNLSPIHLYH